MLDNQIVLKLKKIKFSWIFSTYPLSEPSVPSSTKPQQSTMNVSTFTKTSLLEKWKIIETNVTYMWPIFSGRGWNLWI